MELYSFDKIEGFCVAVQAMQGGYHGGVHREDPKWPLVELLGANPEEIRDTLLSLVPNLATCTIVNKRTHTHTTDDVYIGRGSVWGNPYVIGKDGTREDVVKRYKRYLWERMKSGVITDEMLLELDGKPLVCFCAPHNCHGYVIRDAITYVKCKPNASS